MFFVYRISAREKASLDIKLIWAFWLLVKVNQQPRNLNGVFAEIGVIVELINWILWRSIVLKTRIDLLELT